MAKKHQQASWEHNHYQGEKKPEAAKVPEVNTVGKNKQTIFM